MSCNNSPNPWAQTFSYDPFGNIQKAGNTNFLVTYDTSKNQVAAGQGFSYDANGNTMTGSSHAFTWDAEGKPITADGITLTYDALGRMVEQNGTTQIVYGPTGEKFALMNGQTLAKAFVPLPGRGAAVYGAGGTLGYFRHPDWLVSVRLGSTTSQTVLFDLAYAPYGEAYAESGSVDRAFAGLNQDTMPGNTNGLYDALYREYSMYGGRAKQTHQCSCSEFGTRQ